MARRSIALELSLPTNTTSSSAMGPCLVVAALMKNCCSSASFIGTRGRSELGELARGNDSGPLGFRFQHAQLGHALVPFDNRGHGSETPQRAAIQTPHGL